MGSRADGSHPAWPHRPPWGRPALRFMKIARPESGLGGWSIGGGDRNIAPRMLFILRRPTGLRAPSQEFSMQWTTPTACDLRFGFEITMYVTAR